MQVQPSSCCIPQGFISHRVQVQSSSCCIPQGFISHTECRSSLLLAVSLKGLSHAHSAGPVFFLLYPSRVYLMHRVQVQPSSCCVPQGFISHRVQVQPSSCCIPQGFISHTECRSSLLLAVFIKGLSHTQSAGPAFLLCSSRVYLTQSAGPAFFLLYPSRVYLMHRVQVQSSSCCIPQGFISHTECRSSLLLAISLKGLSHLLLKQYLIQITSICSEILHSFIFSSECNKKFPVMLNHVVLEPPKIQLQLFPLMDIIPS